MATLNDNLFGQSYDQIQKAIFGGTTTNFQMLGAPIVYDFAIAGPGQMNSSVYQILSQMPVWSPVGSFSQDGTTLFSAYQNLLSHVTFKTSDGKAADLDKQQSNINEQQNKLTQAQNDLFQAYNVAKNNGGPPFEEMYPTFKDWRSGPGQAWTSAIEGVSKSLALLNDKYAKDLADITGKDPALSNAMNALVQPDGTPSSGASKAGWVAVADSGGTLRWQPDFTLNKDAAQVRRSLADGTVGNFKIDLSASNSSSALDKSWAGGSVSRDVPFFSVGVGGSWNKLDINNDDKSVSVSISVQSSMLVPVSPGVWYNGGFLKNLALNDSTGGYQLSDGWRASGTGKSVAFGKDGLVSTNVASLVLVYKPSVTVTMSQETFQRNYQKIEAGGGISIGPFTFGGHGGNEKDYTLTSNGSTSFTVQSTSSNPQIIGIGVGFPGLGKADV